MTSILLKNYLNDLDQQMITEKRKILLILDNAQTHPFVQLCNIELLFLPKNTTSIMQTLDMGIIKAFKCHYFNALVNSCDFENLDNNIDFLESINIKYAIVLISIAWDNVSNDSIINCFRLRTR
ncbi:Tigger transposable element-derived protein 6 [Dictyocoela muelleri]|nr:Tigger transposable element-derived protein 6 [Dictyocoela muelleri]